MPFKNLAAMIAWAIVAVFFLGIIFDSTAVGLDKILVSGFVGLITAIMSLE